MLILDDLYLTKRHFAVVAGCAVLFLLLVSGAKERDPTKIGILVVKDTTQPSGTREINPANTNVLRLGKPRRISVPGGYWGEPVCAPETTGYSFGYRPITKGVTFIVTSRSGQQWVVWWKYPTQYAVEEYDKIAPEKAAHIPLGCVILLSNAPKGEWATMEVVVERCPTCRGQ